MWRSGQFWRLVCSTSAVLLAALGVFAYAIANTEILENNLARQSTIIGILIVVWLVATCGIFVIAWRTVRPLRELALAAKQILAGQIHAPIIVDSTHEWNLLARSLNTAREQLAESVERMDDEKRNLRAVLDGMAEGVLAVDNERRIMFANQRARQFLENSGGPFVGRRFWEVHRQRPLNDALEEVLSTGRGKREELQRYGPQAGEVTANINPLTGSQTRGAVFVLHDVTELRRLERLRSDFVANVSHELKTPLAIIKANTETLLDGAIDDLDHRECFLRRIADQADNLHRLILDLLSLARIESGTESFSSQSVSVDAIVENCLAQHRLLADEKRQTLEIVAPDDPVFVWGDEDAVVQIIDNLVANAIKYTPDDGHIEICWERIGDDAVLRVCDTGLGISKAELPRVFERFYRVDKARSRQIGGTGLGLSIVKHLVQSMNGSIQAESTLGEGSTFTIRLPCESQATAIGVES